jgi:hypothetical protein
MLKPLSSTLARTSALLALTLSTCLSAQSFSNPYRIPTASDPSSVVVGDVNGDGLPDILWGDVPTLPNTSSTPAVLHVLLAQTGGGYAPGPSLSLPPFSTGECLLVDLNQDHHLDLVCTNTDQFNDSLQVFLGNGDGTFQAPITTPINNFNSGDYPFPLITSVGDLNGDGFPDLVEVDGESEQTQVLLGDGTGGFKPGILIPNGINGLLPIAADVNGDGIPDLLFPAGPTVELGKGDGTFGPMTSYAAPSYYGATCIFHDMDGDGHLDAVCGYPESNDGDINGATDLIILHGNPDGSFNTTPISDKTFGDHNTEFDGYGTFLTPTYIADINGDGIPDVLGNSGDGLAVLLGGPGLTFSTPLHYAQAVVGYGFDQIYSLYQSQIVDMNGDGVPDIVAAGPNGIYITYGQKNGSFASAFAPEVAEVIGYPTVADFNGDGIPDIAATGDTAIKLSLGKGDGTFGAPTALSNNNGAIDFSTPLSATNAHILHGDFNGDGKLDLLAIGSPGIYQYNSYILFGHGDGTFNAPVLVPNSSVVFPMSAQLTDSAVFDINHDGRSDILSSSTNNTGPPGPGAQIAFALSNGDGTFKNVSTPVPFDLQQGAFAYITFPALTDFNQDGKLDAVYGSVTNVYVVNGHGDGTFDTTSTPLPIPTISGQASQETLAVATGDFDGDGNQDFAVLVQYGIGQFPYPNPLATAAWVFYGNGNGTFSSPMLAGTFDRNYAGIAAADLNNDGLTDIILQTGGSLGGGYAIGTLNSQSGRTFGPEVNYTAGTGLSSLSIVDVNKDGLPDLVFGNGDFNVRASSVTVLLNKESGSSGGGSSTTTNLTCNPSTISIGATSLFSAVVTSSSGTPTGSITFTDNGVTLAQPTLTSGDASLTYTGNTGGTHNIVATYVPTGSFGASSASCPVTVNTLPTTAVLTVSATNVSYGTPVTLTATITPTNPPGPSTPTGTVTFSYTNPTTTVSTALATVNLTAGVANLTTSTLPVGSDNLNCTYSGSSIYSPSNCNSMPITIATPPITLTSSLNPAPALTSITFTAQLGSGNTGGTIVFNVDGQNITTTPNAAGTSTYTISTLTQGSYPITAAWFASANALSVQATLTQLVTAAALVPDFSFTGTNATFPTGSDGSGNLQLASLNSFTGTIAITCNPPFPINYTCTLQKSSIVLTSGLSTSFTYSIHTDYTASTAPLHLRERTPGIFLASFFPFTLLSLFSFARKRRAPLRLLLSLALFAVLTSTITACGPDHYIEATPPGTYPINLTATGTSQGSTTPITHTLTVNAIITR